jgi:hypothetical protein
MLLAATCVGVTTTVAEVIEIPLPGLLGSYPLEYPNATRTAAFQLPAPPLEIHGASFRISGTAGVGSIVCEWGGPYPWPMMLSASMRAEFARFWFAEQSMPEVPGPFQWTAQFHANPPTTTWEFLMDGVAEVSLFGAPAGLVDLCWPVGPYPTGTVEEAVLIVDAEFPVPVAETSWGRIKALFESP